MYQTYRQNKRFDWGRDIPFMGESIPGGKPGIDTDTYRPNTDAAAMDAEVMVFEKWRQNWSICDSMQEMPE